MTDVQARPALAYTDPPTDPQAMQTDPQATQTDPLRHEREALRTRVAERMLPKARYLSADMHRLEMQRLWPNVWQWACLEEDLGKLGAFRTYEIGDQSVLITRGAERKLRAFYNVCQHRGNRLRTGAGVTREIACIYHHWTWNLDGTLKSIPDRDQFDPMDDACLALRQVRIDTWNGFVFICLDPEAPELLDYLAPLTEKLAPYHFEQQTCTRSVTMPIAANWKTVVDGFVEVYHLQGIHPQLLRFLDDVNTTYEVWGRHSAMYMPMGIPSPRLKAPDDDVTLRELSAKGSGYHGKVLRSSRYFREVDGKAELTDGVTVRQALIEAGRAEAEELGRDYSGLTDAQVADDHHYFFFPNVIMNIDAGHFIASRIRPHATDPEQCYFDMHVFDWLSPEQKAARPRRQHVEVAPGTEVGRVPDQDFTALPTVQLGLHSNGFENVRLSDQECRVLAFHTSLDEYLFPA